MPSSYAIEVYDENDIVNAVKFARDFNIRLVVKGTGMFLHLSVFSSFNYCHRILFIIGHDYDGRSSAPNSLLIWTHSMRDIEFMDKFIPAGKEGVEGIPAVRLEAGLTWMDVYAAASQDRDLVGQFI